MSWENVVIGIVNGIGNFFYDFGNVIGGALTPATIEGLIGLACLSIILRVLNGGYRKSREELNTLRLIVKKYRDDLRR